MDLTKVCSVESTIVRPRPLPLSTYENWKDIGRSPSESVHLSATMANCVCSSFPILGVTTREPGVGALFVTTSIVAQPAPQSSLIWKESPPRREFGEMDR